MRSSICAAYPLIGTPIVDMEYYFKANDKDETEYGPVEQAQIRDWLIERRMDGNSQVRSANSEDWSPLSGALLEDIVDPQSAQACRALDYISAEDWVREVVLATRVISWG